LKEWSDALRSFAALRCVALPLKRIYLPSLTNIDVLLFNRNSENKQKKQSVKANKYGCMLKQSASSSIA
jgi:hypothetical protein